MPHPKPAEGNVALIRPPEGAVAAAAPASEVDARWVWFEDEHGERFRVPRSWVQGAPAGASTAGGSAEEADPDEAGEIRIKNPTLARMFEGVRLTPGQASLVPKLQAFLDDDEARIFILRGYAGTGKTFLMKGVVDYLSTVNRSVHLMAPTGRAAKVLSTRTSRKATRRNICNASGFHFWNRPLSEPISLKTNRARGQKACGPERQMKMSKARACPPARCCRHWDCRS